MYYIHSHAALTRRQKENNMNEELKEALAMFVCCALSILIGIMVII
jgi:hypothetical protein